jgi:hypothetical protein
MMQGLLDSEHVVAHAAWPELAVRAGPSLVRFYHSGVATYADYWERKRQRIEVRCIGGERLRGQAEM